MSKKIIKAILYIIAFIVILNLIGGFVIKYYFCFHGWKFILPEKIPDRMVIISTETIENDSLLLYTYASQLNLLNHYMITKKETFGIFFLLKSMFYVDRSVQNNLVNSISKFLENKPRFVVGLFPEGKTRNTKDWKSGFYHIAKKSRASIGIVGIDHDTKTVKIDNTFEPSDNYEKDLKHVQDTLRKYPVAIKEKCNLFDVEIETNKKQAISGLTPIHEIL